MTNAADETPPPVEKPADDEAKTIVADELFKGRREILIEHAGETYRLRITRRNKLILQK